MRFAAAGFSEMEHEQRCCAAMTLTLADIERWDPAAIRTVFDAAIRRAHGTRTASAAITEMMRLLSFGGDAAEAAHAATRHTALDLDDHADACDAVARAAEQSAEEVDRDQAAAQGDPGRRTRKPPGDR